jgi:hypothetical protein
MFNQWDQKFIELFSHRDFDNLGLSLMVTMHWMRKGEFVSAASCCVQDRRPWIWLKPNNI